MGDLRGAQPFRKAFTAQKSPMIHRHDSIRPEKSLHRPGKRSKTINLRKSAISDRLNQDYIPIPITCLAALFVARSREPHLAAVNLFGLRYEWRFGTAKRRRSMAVPDGLASVLLANRSALARYVRARFRGDGDAEDILQDLWLKLASLESGPVADPLSYLYRMAENLVLDRRRSAMRRVNREKEWTRGQIDGTVEFPIDSAPDAERILLARDHLQRVNAALDQLPERTALAFRAVRIDGTAQSEIAAAMAISLSAVEKHLQKAYRAVTEVKHQLDADNEPPDRLVLQGQDNDG